MSGKKAMPLVPVQNMGQYAAHGFEYLNFDVLAMRNTMKAELFRDFGGPMDDFSPKVVKRSSSACYGLCVWVRAMDVYSRVIKVVAPKRVRLKEAEADSKACTKELKAKQKVLRGVEDTLAQLQAQLAGKQAELEELQTQVQPNPNPHQP